MLSDQILVGADVDLGRLSFEAENRTVRNIGDTIFTAEGGSYWSIRARLGYATNQFLPYISAGVIGTSVDIDIEDTCTDSPCGTDTIAIDESDGRTSGLFGIGAEYRLSAAWSVTADWMTFDLDRVEGSDGDGLPGRRVSRIPELDD